MESLGDKLRTARNEKGISIDQVSRDTNITTRYIEALESENFSIFPGEPYIIGFLRNYSAYLDLDAQKVISLYKALRIQETPIPVEQLIKHPPVIPKFLLPAFIILAVIAGATWGIYNLVLYAKNKPAKVVPVTRAPTEYMMEGNSMERRFYKNDSVLIQVDDDMYKLELFNLGEAVTIRTPGGSVVLDLSQESSVDLNNDGIPELRITVSDFAKNNADMGAQLHFYLMDAVAVRDAVVDSDQPVPVVATTSTVSSVTTTIIPPSPRAYPFTLQANFQGYCMFRWEILNERDRRDRTQRYFQRNEELSINAQNGIRLWTSNAQAARFQVIGGGRTIQLEVGTPGEIAVADIRWVRDENNQYRLVLIRLETGT
jgi:cytoskeletal protein RodZ